MKDVVIMIKVIHAQEALASVLRSKLYINLLVYYLLSGICTQLKTLFRLSLWLLAVSILSKDGFVYS